MQGSDPESEVLMALILLMSFFVVESFSSGYFFRGPHVIVAQFLGILRVNIITRGERRCFVVP